LSIGWPDFAKRYSVNVQIAMELFYRYRNYKQKELGAIFGTDFSAVSQNRVRLKNKLKSSRKLKKHYDRILIQIKNMSNSKIPLLPSAVVDTPTRLATSANETPWFLTNPTAIKYRTPDTSLRRLPDFNSFIDTLALSHNLLMSLSII
jgi:hypothetical protein